METTLFTIKGLRHTDLCQFYRQVYQENTHYISLTLKLEDYTV